MTANVRRHTGNPDGWFEPLKGQPCWGVKRGYGSFLTLEFGRPRLVVREPQIVQEPASRRIKAVLARRHVKVRGQWHLWIYCCTWEVRQQGRVVGDSSSNSRIDRAARCLDGQKLVAVTLRPRGARTLFRFDLGAELETRPYDRSSSQWMLYEPDGFVLSLRADRKYRRASGQDAPDSGRWKPVET